MLESLEVPRGAARRLRASSPDHLYRYAESARGPRHPGDHRRRRRRGPPSRMLAAKTILPVIGVPMPTKALDGLDSLLSIVQMPRGIPVATVAIGNAENAALLAVEILALSDPDARHSPRSAGARTRRGPSWTIRRTRHRSEPMDDPRWEPGMPVLDRQPIGAAAADRIPETEPTPLQKHYINLSAIALIAGAIVITALNAGVPMTSPLVKLWPSSARRSSSSPRATRHSLLAQRLGVDAGRSRPCGVPARLDRRGATRHRRRHRGRERHPVRVSDDHTAPRRGARTGVRPIWPPAAARRIGSRGCLNHCTVCGGPLVLGRSRATSATGSCAPRAGTSPT